MKNFNFKSFFTGCVITTILFTSSLVFAANTKTLTAVYNNIKIFINGKEVNTKNDQPFIVNGRTYVPARYIAEGLNANVDWDATNKIITINSKQNQNNQTDIPNNQTTPLPSVISTPTPIVNTQTPINNPTINPTPTPYKDSGLWGGKVEGEPWNGIDTCIYHDKIYVNSGKFTKKYDIKGTWVEENKTIKLTKGDKSIIYDRTNKDHYITFIDWAYINLDLVKPLIE